MKYLKWLLGLIFLLVVIAFLFLQITNEKEPVGSTGSEADNLALAMQSALNKDAFDKLNYLQWTFFRGQHHYRWDKKNNIAEILWDDNKVVMQLDSHKGLAYQNQAPVLDTIQRNALMNEAWKYWCNDSFWLIAPFKAFDPGTSRSLVEEDGKTKLKVSYNSGGVTPGDVYLWELGADNKPVAWKMWTSIIPKKGFETTWEKYIELPGGAQISTFHSNALIDMEMKGIKGAHSLADLGWLENTFKYK